MRQIERRRLQQGEGRKGRSVRRRRVVVTLDAYFHPYAVTSPLPNPPPDHQGHPLRPSASLASEQAVGNGRFCISGALPAHIGCRCFLYPRLAVRTCIFTVCNLSFPESREHRITRFHRRLAKRGWPFTLAPPKPVKGERKTPLAGGESSLSPLQLSYTQITEHHIFNHQLPPPPWYGVTILAWGQVCTYRQNLRPAPNSYRTLYQRPLGSAYPLIIHLQRQDDSSSKRAFITNSEHERELSFPNIMQVPSSDNSIVPHSVELA
ncbi:hypothetical protein CPSG_00637 [Coccidioides posadasii str. Silveira]|uniref:Uncharacterized protein n=1 Tax=Coccidioides posadasii (strain RMSCC 757 / Silveira) TaxID=443226 RepID=E9CSS8_COCPS|nr:hypothetical protein CPSG_00637 [Coccidioides posadasii str. Silveira]